jgi:protein-tyrosine phosphatase
MTQARVVPLEGGCNFRDFGGYRTEDGRRVRWSVLFRSGVLARISAKGVAALRELGVRAVCDLRRNDERARHPNPEFGADVRQYAWDTQAEVSPIREHAFATATSLDAGHAAMAEMYGRMPVRMQERLAGTVSALLDCTEGAFVVHCAAGKDRTGAATALILAMLGVPRAQIVEDYLLTNTAVDLAAQLTRPAGAGGVGLAATAAPILALTPAARAAVLEAHPSYLLAMFDAIESQWGSVDEYLQVGLRLGAARIEATRDRLLVAGTHDETTKPSTESPSSSRGAA